MFLCNQIAIGLNLLLLEVAFSLFILVQSQPSTPYIRTPYATETPCLKLALASFAQEPCQDQAIDQRWFEHLAMKKESDSRTALRKLH